MEMLSIENLINLLKNNLGIIFIFLLLVFLYNYYTSTHDHFAEKGIPFIKPVIILGNIGPRIFLRTSFHEFNIKLYKHFDGLPYGGFFEGRRPALIVRSPELIKAIMIKDFDHFVDRNTMNGNASPSITKMLINLKGKEWKKVRANLTPTFSSGKLRAMGNLFEECGHQLSTYLKNRPDGDYDIEMKEFIGRYTLEVIGSCAFGLECNSLKNPNAEFVKIAAKLFEINLAKRSLLFFCIVFFPTILKYLPVNFANTEVLEHLNGLVMATKKDREETTRKRRNDFMQLLLDVAKNETNDNSDEKTMTDDMIKAQAILFLFAGFETTSTLLSFCASVLCEYPDIQDKLRKQITIAADNKEDKSTYDMINEIPLLELILLETLRMYPPVSRVDRTCTKPYTLPGTDLTVNIGEVVVIPIAGILHDPEYYPNPDEFRPERFSPEEKARRPTELFLPFGMGPRNCIGLRFAMMSAKYGLYYLIKDFQLSPCSKTQYPIQYNKRAFLLKADGGNWVKAKAI